MDLATIERRIKLGYYSDRTSGETYSASLLAQTKKRGLERLLEGPIINLGCGPGYEILAFTEKFPKAKVLGVDLNPDCVEYAKKLGLDVIRADASSVDFPDGLFKIAFSRYMFDLDRNEETVAPEVMRILEKGGLYYMVDNKCDRFTATFVAQGFIPDRLHSDAYLFIKP